MIGLKADEGGASFWVGILNILRLRKHSTKSKSNLLQYFTKMEGIDIFFLEAEQGDFLNQRIIEGNAVAIATDFRGQIFGKLPLILAQLLKEKEGDQEASDEIDILCQSTQYVCRYVKLNAMLQNPWSLPISAVTNSSVLITEAGLINLLNKDKVSKATGKVVSHGSGKNPASGESWLDSSSQAMVQPQGSFWKLIFGNKLGGNCSIIIIYSDILGRFKCSHIGEYMENQSKPTPKETKEFRYVLGTSIVTNGFSVSCLVRDLKTLKPKATLDSTLSLIDQAKALRRRKRPTSDCLPDDWKSKVKKIIGIDFGETYSGGFCLKNMESYSKDENGSLAYDAKGWIHNLVIKTKALTEPTRRYQKWLESAKKSIPKEGAFLDETIFEKEMQMGKGADESYLEYTDRWKLLYKELSSFYNSKMVNQ